MPSCTVSPVFSSSSRSFGRVSFATSMRRRTSAPSSTSARPRRYLPVSAFCSRKRAAASVVASRCTVLFARRSRPASAVMPSSFSSPENEPSRRIEFASEDRRAFAVTAGIDCPCRIFYGELHAGRNAVPYTETPERNGMKSSLALAAFLAAAVAAPLAGAQSYAGKTVTIIVGFKPGGGYDAVARVLARHLTKHIPGKPTVIVQNMPGGNSIIAANHIYNVAKADGLTLGTFNRNLPIAQLTKVAGVKFDMLQFAWIGSAANETTILAGRNELPYKTFHDLRNAKQQVLVGSTGPRAKTYYLPPPLDDLLGAYLKLVSRYSSSS